MVILEAGPKALIPQGLGVVRQDGSDGELGGQVNIIIFEDDINFRVI